jgi:hypothetical protein
LRIEEWLVFRLVMTLLRRCGLASGVFALAIAIQVPAHAETYNHADVRHDVERAPESTRAPRYREADVTHLQVVHNNKAVRFNITLRSAALKGVQFRTIGYTLKTSGHHYSGVFIKNHDRSVQYILFDDTEGQEIDLTCNESSGRNGRTIWLRIDRSCLGKPRWIRASIGVGTVLGTNNSRGDNALSNKWRETNTQIFTPRVHTGKG